MQPQGSGGVSHGSLTLRVKNKFKRKELWVLHKQASAKQRKRERLSRRKEEDGDPELRKQRLEKNIPASIDRKRTWDDADDDNLGAVVDLAHIKRQRLLSEAAESAMEAGGMEEDRDELDSLLDSDRSGDDDDDEEEGEGGDDAEERKHRRDTSLAPSTTSTNLDLTPSSLISRFPTLFSDEIPALPKILITTTLNSTLHHEANLLCGLFPNAQYTPRSSHRYGHKYSLRDISKFATNRGFTSLLVLREDLKKPSGLDIVHLPSGPTLSFSISSFTDCKKLPGHGVSTNHYPELLLNNFKTPLGLLTAKVFETLFGRPEVAGRMVVSITNRRDYLFLNRWRYVYREKKLTEKPAVSAEGKEIPGGIRVGLQVLGPKIHMKLRRVYRGIGRAGSEGEDGVQWEWKAKMEKNRTRFQL